jgi:precorrin-3B C17-methyltransferase
MKLKDLTTAVAEKSPHLKGLISVVGTGPGAVEHITPAVMACIHEADVVIGYSTYLELLADQLVGKKIFSSAMMQEVARCNTAFDLADAGNKVVMVSGGDPGIYAMAGLLFEIAIERNSPISIEVFPGIAAINSCAARLGAPLMHDFAAVSLSDLLTPWETIERRLHAAASADFVIALYNPKSKKRTEHIIRARDILLKYRQPSTPVGIVKGATRTDERVLVTDLENMLNAEITMQTTIIIGSSCTYSWRGKMVTPRGYGGKYALQTPREQPTS